MGIDSEHDDGPEVSIHSSKHGRPSCSVWELLMDEANASSKTQAVCKSCNQTVKYHKKSEIAKKHLNACSKFKATMYDVASNDLPEWFASHGRKTIKFHTYIPTTSNTAAHRLHSATSVPFRSPNSSRKTTRASTNCWPCTTT